MANAVTFWKGTFAKYQEKITAGLADGRIYFITDAGNESLYLKDVLISPKRLTALTADLNDTTSVATAKAIVDFVKSQVEGAFAEGSAYAEALKSVTDRLDAIEAKDAAQDAILAGYGVGEGLTTTVKSDIEAVNAAIDTKVAQSAYDVDKAATDAILAGFGTEEGQVATVKAALDLKANADDVYTKEEVGNMLSAALEFKGTVEAVENLPETGETGDVYYVKADQSEYVWVDATHKWEKLGPVVDYTQFAQASNVYTKGETDGLLAGKVDNTITVNGKALSANVTLTGADIAVDASDSSTVAAKLGELEEAIEAIVGGGDGDTVTLEGLSLRVSNVEGIVDGIGGTDEPATVVAAIEAAVAPKVDQTSYDEKIEEIEGRLDATEGVANGAAAAVATKVEQEAYNTKMGEIDAAIADRYTKEEVDGAISGAIEAATLVWVED